jgi:hypothetical protein
MNFNNMIRWKISLGSFVNCVKERAVLCLGLALMIYPSTVGTQEKIHPHLQIFLVTPRSGENISFIAFWDGAHKLQSGPFPLKLMERAGFEVSLNLTYTKSTDKLPTSGRLKIQRRDNAPLPGPRESILLDQPVDFIADRGVSKMFPDGPFFVIGHKALSEGILQVGNMMGEIQRRLMACDKEYRQELETVLNSLMGTSSYDHVSRTIVSIFPRCPHQRP